MSKEPKLLGPPKDMEYVLHRVRVPKWSNFWFHGDGTVTKDFGPEEWREMIFFIRRPEKK